MYSGGHVFPLPPSLPFWRVPFSCSFLSPPPPSRSSRVCPRSALRRHSAGVTRSGSHLWLISSSTWPSQAGSFRRRPVSRQAKAPSGADTNCFRQSCGSVDPSQKGKTSISETLEIGSGFLGTLQNTIIRFTKPASPPSHFPLPVSNFGLRRSQPWHVLAGFRDSCRDRCRSSSPRSPATRASSGAKSRGHMALHAFGRALPSHHST